MASALYPHQQNAVDAALANQTTLIEQACGTGKKDNALSVQDKAEALAAYLEHEGKAPPYRPVTEDGFRLGTFWQTLVGRHQSNKATVEAVLARRPAARAVYERELCKRKECKDRETTQAADGARAAKRPRV